MRILQDSLSPDVKGIIWVTKAPLQQHPYPFDSLDYFFDGTLTESLKNLKSPLPEKNIFFSTSFGRPFFLAQLSQESCIRKRVSKEIFDVIKTIESTDNKVLVLEHIKRQSADMFQKIYPHLKFTSLHLS